MRLGYKTDCRFFRDRPEIVTRIKWIRAQPTAKVLGFPSVINNRMMDAFPYENDDIGEVWGAKHSPVTQKPIPGALGDHVCGTPGDFAEGAIYNPDLPPVVYTTTGLPVCCNPVVIGKGGIGFGGKSYPSIIPAPPVPSATCSGAPTLTLGTVYSFSTDAVAGSQQWTRYPVVSGTTYNWAPSGFAALTTVSLFEGATCAGLTLRTPAAKIPQPITALASDFIYVQVIHVSGPMDAYSYSLT